MSEDHYHHLLSIIYENFKPNIDKIWIKVSELLLIFHRKIMKDIKHV